MNTVFDLVRWYAPERRSRVLVLSAISIITIALIDWLIVPNIGLGFLYVFPILLVAGFLSRGQILVVTLLCAVFRELFSPFHHNNESLPRTIFVWIGFTGVGWFLRELVTNRQQAVEHLSRLQTEVDLRVKEAQLREDAERHLKALIDSSPAAILMVTESGSIELCNHAAQRLFRTNNELLGKNISNFMPDIAVIQNRLGLNSSLRTGVECRGMREDGEIFLGHVWMSLFQTHKGVRVAIIVSDVSEQLRDREEGGLEQSLANSRLLVSAVSHEVRNLCSAVAIAHTNLGRVEGLPENTDYKSLGMLVDGLRQLSSAELMPVTKAAQEGLQLRTMFDDLRIVLQPAAEEAAADLVWNIPAELPPVRADRQGLFQVFLNLSYNSFRAMRNCPTRMLTISSKADLNLVTIRFRDSGPGVSHPDQLFKLFHSGSNSSGIGLYISRAILRSYGADIRYEFGDSGACFAIELLRSQGTPN
jgi:PAS domain S-box-containing protein